MLQEQRDATLSRLNRPSLLRRDLLAFDLVRYTSRRVVDEVAVLRAIVVDALPPRCAVALVRPGCTRRIRMGDSGQDRYTECGKS